MNTTTMRDAFFDRLYEIARQKRDVILVSADMGSPSLDKFRRDLASQFVNVGIAEENMVTVGTGLALSGKKVFLYAIMPFATSRCYEMIKLDLSLMNVPVTVVGVGAGFSYEDSGPTHHSTEDIAIMRVLPNMTIFNPSDRVMAAQCAEIACNISGPSYIRLDREMLPLLYDPDAPPEFSIGVTHLKAGKDVCLIATGNMVHSAIKIAENLADQAIDAAVIDLYRLKPIDTEALLQVVEQSAKIVTLEEHLYNGGVGSAVVEILVDHGKTLPVKRFAIPDKYYYAYGGRKHIQTLCGLDIESITRGIINWL